MSCSTDPTLSMFARHVLRLVGHGKARFYRCAVCGAEFDRGPL